MIPTHYADRAKPALSKRRVALDVLPVPVPLKGLSLAFKNTAGDPETAVILRNFTVEDDCIKVRAGFRKKVNRGTAEVWHLVPFYGTPSALAAASNHELWDAQSGNLIQGGFTSDDWMWTAFSNLGDRDYTVMVNGADGVWSWDGGFSGPGAPVAVTSLSFTNPAKVTMASTAGFTNGMLVTVSGADAAHAMCNGTHIIGNVTPTTFDLLGVNSTSAGANQTTGVTVCKAGSIFKETITVDSADTWISPNSFDTVVVHQNQLFFADKSNLAIYYLPKLQKSGLVAYLPLNAIFKRGGYIKAMASWTVEGGTNMSDQLVLFSSNGECAIYGGTDPDTDFTLQGVFRFDAPMSKHSVAQYGGELYVLIPTGLVPMSTLLKAETDKLGQFDRNMVSLFLAEAIGYRAAPGWGAFLNPSTGRMFCNIPQGSPNRYKQFVRHMPKGIWQEFNGLPSRCFGWIDPFVYFGDDSGNVYEFHPVHQSDDGQPIFVDVLTAWNRFKTPAEKQFKGVHTFLITDGNPRPVIDIKVNYDDSAGINQPDSSTLPVGAMWDVAVWDVDYWAIGRTAYNIWNGVAASGDVGAVRLSGYIFNCSFAVTGWDVQFEKGRIAP